MSDWQEASLADLADYINGRAIKPEECSAGPGMPVIRIKQINDPQTIDDCFCGDNLDEKNIVRNGDLLFSWSATLKTIQWQGPAGAINQHIFKVMPRPGIDKTFLHYLIDNSIPALAEESHGSTMKHIKKSALSAFHLRIPPLPEQKKIAEILSGIDNAIASAIKEKQHRERMRRSAVKQLTRGTSYKGQRKDSGTEFGMIPAHWECQLIPICCTIENSKRQPMNKEERATMRGTYPYHGATRIQDYISKYDYEGEYVLIGEDGDHFSKYNEWEMTQYATGRFNVSNHAHVIRGTSNCSTQWLYYSLLHRDLTYHLTRQGATRFKLSKASLECIPALLPPPEEQEQMVNVFKSITNSISILGNRVIKLQALKKALSADLLSGRKRVSI